MTTEEAREWLKGNRSMCNCISSSDLDSWQVRTAQADAAMLEQAYWVLKAHKEGLVLGTPSKTATKWEYAHD